MDHPPYAYINSLEAYSYKETISDDSARSALILVHNALLELTGKFSWRHVTDHLRPDSPLDELALYKAIATVFERKSEWESLAHDSIAMRITQSVVKARQLAESLANKNAKNGLLAFINTFVTTAPAEQDVVFCCQLLIPIIFNDECLPKVLSGEIARYADEISNDFEKWAESWV